jgi:hypothetical protein
VPSPVGSIRAGSIALWRSRPTCPPVLRRTAGRRAPRGKRIALLVLGPLIWLVALVILAFLLARRDAVEYALIVLVVSFAVALPLLGWSRIARGREEREACAPARPSLSCWHSSGCTPS